MEDAEDKEEGGFGVSFPELSGCIACGETVETAVVHEIHTRYKGVATENQ